jgi:hypothetical protein
VNLTFNNPTLICISIGGPATNVTWKRSKTNLEIDGTIYQQSQIITNTQNAEYRTMLTLPTTSIENFDTTYECIVENHRGSENASLKLQGIIMKSAWESFCDYLHTIQDLTFPLTIVHSLLESLQWLIVPVLL